MSDRLNDQPDFDVDAFIEEHGLQVIANEQLAAHNDEIVTVRDGLERCPPMARMLGSMSVNLASLPNRDELLLNTVRGMAIQSAEIAIPDPKKKLISNPLRKLFQQ